jgi:chromosome segregation ATPase
MMEGQITQTEQLKNEISKMQADNDEILKQINTDAKYEIDDIESKNKQNQNQVNDMSLKSKAELQLTRNKL